MQGSAKAIAGALAAIFVWGFHRATGEALPDDVVGALNVLLVYGLVWLVPNLPR